MNNTDSNNENDNDQKGRDSYIYYNSRNWYIEVNYVYSLFKSINDCTFIVIIISFC